MSIIATAPVSALARPDLADTDQYPILPAPPAPPTSYLSAARATGPDCPPWCVDHTTLSPIAPGEPAIEAHSTGGRIVEAQVTDLDGVTQRTEILVEAVSYDDGAHRPTPPVIFLQDMPMTAATARELAAVLLEVADLIGGAR